MRVLLALVLVAGAILPAQAGAISSMPAAANVPQGAEAPELFVRRVYGRYRHKGPGVSTERPAGTPFYSPALLDAFAKESEAAHGEVGAIDGDPLCGCQDYDDLRIKGVSITSRTLDSVEARVAFINLRQRSTMVLTLSRVGTGWRVADVSGKDMTSLMALLQDSIAHPDVEPAATEVSPSPPTP